MDLQIQQEQWRRSLGKLFMYMYVDKDMSSTRKLSQNEMSSPAGEKKTTRLLKS